MNLPAEMRYIETVGSGGPEVLRLATGPVPAVKPGAVLIRVEAAGINRVDVQQRLGGYSPPPGASAVIGMEVAGEVVACGEGASRYAIGDRVCALVDSGAYAEYCVAPELQCLPWPRGYDAIRAAALPETYFTVWANLFSPSAPGQIKRGQSFMAHGGSSGIGTTAIQLAREFGAGPIYTTVGGADKGAACVRLGATTFIDYKTQDFVEEIKRLTQGKGVDVILDIVGAPYVARNLRCLDMRGRLVMIAFLQGSKIGEFDFSRILLKHLMITGSTLRPRTVAQKGQLAAELRESVWPILDAGRCAPVIDTVFPLAQIQDAHKLMESSRHIGKIMLQVA
jgi:NADPH2:quinone reductase